VTRSSSIALALFVLASGCDALSAYRTAPGEVYSGEVTGSDGGGSGPSFIRQGFVSHTRLDLTFDPTRASAYIPPDSTKTSLPSAGTIDTYTCSVETSPCPPKDRTPGDFAQSKLEVIPNLTHDELSQYDFPGGGRLRNYIVFARFGSPSTGGVSSRTATAYVSLMENGGMEVRVIAPSVLEVDGKTELAPALFGVFTLRRGQAAK